MKSIAVIGGGWSGCHTALELAGAGHQVTVIEKGPHLFDGVHARELPPIVCQILREVLGAGRPRQTRHLLACSPGSTGHESKVNAATFGDVCGESTECARVDVNEQWPNTELECAYKLDEPCAVLNPYLKTYFQDRLSSAGISIRLNDEVTEVKRQEQQYQVLTSTRFEGSFHKVVNATGYMSALPDGLLDNLPVNLDIRYQVCTALRYTDRYPEDSPISFIVMDGWFPCLMPSLSEPTSRGEYVMTHGAYTILGSFDTGPKARECLDNLDPEFVNCHIRPKIEEQMERFWPGFKERFSYHGWKGSVMPKLVTDTEFRSSVVFESGGVIYIFPGKISNVMEAADEVLSLLDGGQVIHASEFGYARDSELSRSRSEIEQRPTSQDRNTCFLQTHQQLCVKS
ncbi:hypothetical protein BJY04DRAFT_219276 [Aspergillus karnatakaensis]|uniref:FAD-dependent oxidoreductase n=1 Tax=Aspergillus karnatakaensis TaxID=1810916 RepID=UPI003CCD8D53